MPGTEVAEAAEVMCGPAHGLTVLPILGSHSCCLSGVHHLPQLGGWAARDTDQVSALLYVPAWPGPRQAAEHPLRNWEWTIYQMPPFLWQEVAPSTVVFMFYFFSTLSGLVVWK